MRALVKPMAIPSGPLGREDPHGSRWEESKEDSGVFTLLADVFEPLPVAVLMVEGRQIAWMNREAEQLLGYRCKELVGRSAGRGPGA